MESDWDWFWWINKKYRKKDNYELWRIWWTICATRTEKYTK